MSSTNQSPQYKKAEAKFLRAQTDEERLFYLKEMIKECPKHKSAEKMLAQLKTRRRKLLEKIEKKKKQKKKNSKRDIIKKAEMQTVVIGFTNTGKSSLLSILTNASPIVNYYEFTTKEPVVGIMDYNGVQIQIIEIPSFNSEYYDKGLVNTADVILILVNDLNQIKEIENGLDKTQGKKLVVYNLKKDDNERKISDTLKSKKFNFVIISIESKKNIEELKERIFKSFEKIRIYTKKPHKKEYSKKPLILKKNSTIKDLAEKVFHNLSNQVKEAFITGPSGKFPNQKVGPKHILKDLDVVEFKTK